MHSPGLYKNQIVTKASMAMRVVTTAAQNGRKKISHRSDTSLQIQRKGFTLHSFQK